MISLSESSICILQHADVTLALLVGGNSTNLSIIESRQQTCPCLSSMEQDTW